MFKDQPLVKEALNQRNDFIAEFWLTEPSERVRLESEIAGCRALMVDAEDAFTEMLAQQLKSMGLLVTIVKHNEVNVLESAWDLVIMGPGPGDPRNINDLRIASIQRILNILLVERRSFLAVCLSHQILCLQLGLELIRKSSPNQGVQRQIDFFGNYERVGFYNTYAAKCDNIDLRRLCNIDVEVCQDIETNEVHALRGSHFASMQFHPESLLTRNGINIIASNVKRIMSL